MPLRNLWIWPRIWMWGMRIKACSFLISGRLRRWCSIRLLVGGIRMNWRLEVFRRVVWGLDLTPRLNWFRCRRIIFSRFLVCEHHCFRLRNEFYQRDRHFIVKLLVERMAEEVRSRVLRELLLYLLSIFLSFGKLKLMQRNFVSYRKMSLILQNFYRHLRDWV